MSDQAFLHITHVDDTYTEIELTDPSVVSWLPTPQGLMLKRNRTRTVWPWVTKSYTVIPRDRPSNQDGPQPRVAVSEVPE